MTKTACPLCQVKGGHSSDCPVGITWTIFNEDERDLARQGLTGGLVKVERGTADWPDLLYDIE